MKNMKEEGWLQFFVGVSCFYVAGLSHSWEKYPQYRTDIWDSLSIFLEGYAFERQGRNPGYSHAAVDVLRKWKETGSSMNEKEIWECFSEKFGNTGLNIKNNPLAPKNTEYVDKNVKYHTKKLSVVEMVLGNKNTPLAITIENKIKDTNDIQNAHTNAHTYLKFINGIGDKIASLYLRDLVVVMKIDLENTRNRHLLQPVDIWVERTVKNLANSENMNKNEVAKWIVNNSKQPELANMGIWFFCSNIAGSEYRLKKVIKSDKLGEAQSLVLVDDFKTRIQKVCKNC